MPAARYKPVNFTQRLFVWVGLSGELLALCLVHSSKINHQKINHLRVRGEVYS